MAIKYSSIFQSKVLQKLPKLGFGVSGAEESLVATVRFGKLPRQVDGRLRWNGAAAARPLG
jgi:hypothetical protein